MTERVVANDEVAAMLTVLGVDKVQPSVDALWVLQRAWTYAQPFHNLDLLAGYAAGRRPLNRRAAWLRCVQGLGGPCHVQASSFLALLTALGFDAHFAAATINHPGDHLVVCAHVDGRSFLCDVGNGHPYTVPFPFDEPSSQTHLGWHVRSEIHGAELRVEQRTPGEGRWRRVYEATAGQRRWEDFEDAILRHHTEADFGPFLLGLRAIRNGADIAYTLRDDVFSTFRRGSIEVETLAKEHECVLTRIMGLGELPVVEAVAVWRRNTGRS